MRHFLTILPLIFALTACNNTTRQWIDPDKEFKEFEQPDVPTIQSTQEAAASKALEDGNLERAAQYYQQLRSQEKVSEVDKIRYEVAIADITRRLDNTSEALELYDDILSRAPDNLEALEGKGLALMALGRIPEAGDSFKEVLEKNPKSWRTLNALGILFASKALLTESFTYYTAALKVSPDNPAILNNIGLTYAIAHDFNNAIATLRHAVRKTTHATRRKQVELNLALVHGIGGNYDAAKQIAEKYLTGPALDNNLGLYAHLANDKELAKTYLNRALTSSPVYYERAWNNLDIINGGQGSAQ